MLGFIAMAGVHVVIDRGLHSVVYQIKIQAEKLLEFNTTHVATVKNSKIELKNVNNWVFTFVMVEYGIKWCTWIVKQVFQTRTPSLLAVVARKFPEGDRDMNMIWATDCQCFVTKRSSSRKKRPWSQVLQNPSAILIFCVLKIHCLLQV